MMEYDFLDLTSCVASWSPLVNEKIGKGWRFLGLVLDGSTKAAVFSRNTGDDCDTSEEDHGATCDLSVEFNPESQLRETRNDDDKSD